MIQYIVYRFYHKQHQCQSTVVGQSHNSMLKVFFNYMDSWEQMYTYILCMVCYTLLNLMQVVEF